MNPPRTIQDYRDLEAQVFPAIPGVMEILNAPDGMSEELEAIYPDASFAIHIANSLFQHNREISLITQTAYFSILRGEQIADIRLRYERELTEYWNQHMWDD